MTDRQTERNTYTDTQTGTHALEDATECITTAAFVDGKNSAFKNCWT